MLNCQGAGLDLLGLTQTAQNSFGTFCALAVYRDFSLFKRSHRYCTNYLLTEMFSLLPRRTLYEISFVLQAQSNS
jgi:hypothetical protein